MPLLQSELSFTADNICFIFSAIVAIIYSEFNLQRTVFPQRLAFVQSPVLTHRVTLQRLYCPSIRVIHVAAVYFQHYGNWSATSLQLLHGPAAQVSPADAVHELRGLRGVL